MSMCVVTQQFFWKSAHFRNSSAVLKVDRDERLQRLQRGATIAHSEDENTKHCPIANLTGIPPHIVDYVNYQTLSKRVDDRFENNKGWLTKELAVR